MMKTRKDIVRLAVVTVIVVCYVFCFAVPYFQTFGQSYVYTHDFYGLELFNPMIPDYPDRYLTLGGTVLHNRLIKNGYPVSIFKGRTVTVSNALCRILLTEQNFDNLFKGASWTHSNLDAKWLRENTKAAWIGFNFYPTYGKIHLQYILKLNDGKVVICHSPALFQQESNGFYLGYAEYFSPCGTVFDFYQHIQ